MIQLRNTPDPDCQLSPAEIVFGRPIRDAFAFINRLEKFSNKHIRPMRLEAWQQKEEALRQRFHHAAEERNTHSRALPDLRVGDRCYIQNQNGNNPKRWDQPSKSSEETVSVPPVALQEATPSLEEPPLVTEVPTSVTEAPPYVTDAPQRQPPSPTVTPHSPRPRRNSKTPRKYVPETGHWE